MKELQVVVLVFRVFGGFWGLGFRVQYFRRLFLPR